jgi:hypothetical protein
MLRLTPNFRLAEFLRSETADAKGIVNRISLQEIERLVIVAKSLEKVRALFGAPISISSGFRNDALNKAVGGVPNSDHNLGYAVDFNVKGFSPVEVCAAISKSDILYDQLIEEFGRWTHISFNPRLRRENLTAKRVGNKISYIAGNF